MYNLSQTKKTFNHFSISERNIIQNLSRSGKSVTEISNLLGKHKSSISRQLNNKRNTDWIRVNNKVKRTYVAKIAQEQYEKNKHNCGAKYKLFKDPNLIKYLEDAVINKKWSPEVAIGRAKSLGWNFKIYISAKSVYNYIDRNQIKITPFHLRFKLRRKKPNKQYVRQNKKRLGKSIEERPEFISDRTQFGHWEGDTVVDKNCNSVFVLTERLTRFGFMLKLKYHTSDEVLKQIKILKRKFGKQFKNIFKTITFDNGSEFYRAVELENKNLQVYFTHPYCSYEKGGVENYNGIIRRYLPKGKDFKLLTRQKIQATNSQINNTPRKILNFKTSTEMFNIYLDSIIA
jgi:transposase, IS30 family